MAKNRKPKTDRSQQPKQAGDEPTRPLWVRAVAVIILVGLIAAFVISRRQPPREKTAIAIAADKADPEIAALFREIDDVACTVSERFPESPQAREIMARLHYRLGESEAAVRYWEECIELDSYFCPAYHSLGLLYLETGENDKAVKYFRKAVELEPDSPAFGVELAQALMSNGQPEEAVEILLDDHRRHPKALATLAMLGHAYIQLHEYEKAKQFFEEAIVVGPDYSNAYNGLVQACTNLGQEDLAKEYAEKVKTMKAQEAETHRGMLKSFDDATNVKGTMGEIYTAAANVYLFHNDPVTAEEYLVKALQLAPECVAAHEVLTWLYQVQGRKKDAIKALQKMLEVVPDRVSAQIGCADLCAEMGWFDQAETAYRKAMELTPEQAGGYAALAFFYVNQVRNLPEAKKLAQKAVDLEPLAKHYHLLGIVCQMNGDKAGARAAIKRAADLEPENPSHQELLQVLEQQK